MRTADAKRLSEQAAAKAHVARNALLQSDPVTARLFETIELLSLSVAALADKVSQMGGRTSRSTSVSAATLPPR